MCHRSSGHVSWLDFYEVMQSDAYQSMTDEDVEDNDLLKNSLLKSFRLRQGGYRKRFKLSKIQLVETPEQFTDRLMRYLQKWCQTTAIQQTYEGLYELTLKDQLSSS